MSAPLIEGVRAQLQYVLNQFLLSFSFVPEEKLFWRPAPQSKNAIELAAHIALVLERQMKLVIGEPLEALPLPEMLSQLSQREQSFSDRGSVVSYFEKAKMQALHDLKNLPDERLTASVVFFGREMPMRAMLSVLVNHVWIHTGQLDYLQTMWGDSTARFL